MFVVKASSVRGGFGGLRSVESLYMGCPGLCVLWRLLVLTWMGRQSKRKEGAHLSP